MPYIDKNGKPVLWEETNYWNEYRKALIYYPVKAKRIKGVTPIVTPSMTPTQTPTNTPTASMTPTITPSQTTTNTPTPTITSSNTPTPTPSTPSGDPDAQAYLADVVASGGTTNPTIESAVDTLFTDLKSNGLYSKLDIFYPFVGGTESSHAINANLNKTYDATFNGGITHDISGSTANGVNGWSNTNFPISAYTENNYSVGYYQYTDNNIGDYIITGVSKISPTIPPVITLSTNVFGNYFMRLGGDIAASSPNNGNRDGFICGSRQDNLNAYFYRNGNSVMSLNETPSGGSSENEVWDTLIYTRNKQPNIGSSTPKPDNAFYANEGINFYYIGEGLSSSEISTLSTIINTFQTSLGRNVY